MEKHRIVKYEQVKGGSNKGFKFKSLPICCDCCGEKNLSTYIDGATARGWAYMCEKCYSKYGKGLGIGLGQKYKITGE